MCGIFGVSWVGAKKSVRTPLLPRTLTYMNQERGKDSFGSAFMPTIEEPSWKTMHTLGDPHDYLKVASFAEEQFTAEIMLGHCRAASGGTKTGTLCSVHPFRFGDIIGAHNGFISNWHDLKKECGEQSAEIDIDSKLLIWRLANLPLEDVFKELEGKIASWWVNLKEPDVFYLYSWNKELAISNDGFRPLVFSSDVDHIRQVGIDKDKITDLATESGQLLKVSPKRATSELVGKFPGKKASAIVYSSSNYTGEQYRLGYEEIYERYKNRSMFTSRARPEPETTGYFSNIRQLDGWSVVVDNDDEKAKARAIMEMIEALYNTDPVGQCWECKLLFRPKTKGGALLCPKCNKTGTFTSTNEVVIVTGWLANQLELEELEAFAEYLWDGEGTRTKGTRKDEVMNALEAVANFKSEAEAVETDKELAEIIKEENENNGEIAGDTGHLHAAMSQRMIGP